MDKQELNDKLLSVSQKGDLDTVKYLLTSSELKDHADIHCKDKNGENALMWACHSGSLEIVKYLLIDMSVTIDSGNMIWLKGRNEHNKVYEDILNLIKSRNLYNKLNKSIRDDKINNKKIKL